MPSELAGDIVVRSSLGRLGPIIATAPRVQPNFKPLLRSSFSATFDYISRLDNTQQDGNQFYWLPSQLNIRNKPTDSWRGLLLIFKGGVWLAKEGLFCLLSDGM
jgi:hypothetical protein